MEGGSQGQQSRQARLWGPIRSDSHNGETVSLRAVSPHVQGSCVDASSGLHPPETGSPALTAYLLQREEQALQSPPANQPWALGFVLGK